MKATRYVKKAFSAVPGGMLALLIAVSLPAHGGGVIAQITAVIPEQGIIEINGAPYTLQPDPGEGGRTRGGRTPEVEDFRAGQVVVYEAEEGVIRRISVQEGLTEVPN
jgi:hypothetical protein